MLLFLICLVIVILFLRALFRDINRTCPNESKYTHLSEWHVPDIHAYSDDDIIKYTHSAQVYVIEYWWKNSLTAEEKSKLSERVIKAIEKKIAQPYDILDRALVGKIRD